MDARWWPLRWIASVVLPRTVQVCEASCCFTRLRWRRLRPHWSSNSSPTSLMRRRASASRLDPRAASDDQRARRLQLHPSHARTVELSGVPVLSFRCSAALASPLVHALRGSSPFDPFAPCGGRLWLRRLGGESSVLPCTGKNGTIPQMERVRNFGRRRMADGDGLRPAPQISPRPSDHQLPDQHSARSMRTRPDADHTRSAAQTVDNHRGLRHTIDDMLPEQRKERRRQDDRTRFSSHQQIFTCGGELQPRCAPSGVWPARPHGGRSEVWLTHMAVALAVHVQQSRLQQCRDRHEPARRCRCLCCHSV